MKSCLLGLLLLPTLALAFEPLNTDDAGTVKAGGNQIEQYFFFINRSAGTQSVDIITPGEEYSGNADARAFPFTYTRGLSETVEASFATTYYKQPSGNYSRFSNYVFATKWRFHEDSENGYAMAIKPTVILPSSKQQQVNGLGLAAVNYGFNFITSKYWDEFEVHVNASYMRSPYNTNYSIGHTADNSRTNIVLASIAPVWSVYQNVKLALDLGATTNPPVTQQYWTYYGLVAGIFSLTDSVDLGISYMRTVLNFGDIFAAQQAASTRTELGITWRF
jgi:hypothetical protein